MALENSSVLTSEKLDLNAALDFLCSEAKRLGADEFDAVATESESIGLELFESKVSNTDLSNARGAGIRLFKNGRPGLAFTEKTSREALTQTVVDAMGHAELTDPLELDLPEGARLPDLDLEQFNPDLENLSFESMKERALRLEQAARDADERVENIPYLGMGRRRGRVVLRNSRGVEYDASGNSVSAYVGVVAVSGDSKKMGVYSNGGRSVDVPILEPAFMASRAVERAVELLGASPLSAEEGAGGSLPIVFSNRVSGRMLSMFAAPFYAENAQKGQSRLKGRLGERIASDILNITCDPHLVGMPGSRLFDGEGVLTQARSVVRAGVFEAFLYNLEAAKREGTAPTGNASRSYAGRAGTGFSNYIVAPGESSLEELLKAYPLCLYVTKLEGGAGCSAVSGEISIGMQGFLYKNGRRVRAVDGMTLNSNYFDMLPLIRGLSRDYSDAWSSTRVPDMLIESMFVGA